MERISLNSVRKVLPDCVITEACQAVGHRFRTRKITPILTILHMILAALWPEDSFNAAWQTQWDSSAARLAGQAGKSPSSGSVAKARGRLPLKLFEELWRSLRQHVEEVGTSLDLWRGHRLVLIDGTCPSMADEPELRRAFGRPRGPEYNGRFPTARIVTLALARTMCVLNYTVGSFSTGEVTLMRSLLATLNPGDLLVGDRHFAGANLYGEYSRRGIEFLTRTHGSLKLRRLKLFHVYAANDFIAWITVHPGYRKKDPTLPQAVLVRLTQGVVRVRGKRQTIWLTSSLLNAKDYPAGEIMDVFGKRWRIETLFKELKVGLGADMLRSRTAAGIHKEIAARMMALNIVRLIMLEAAVEFGVDPLRISFVHALRALLAFAPVMASAPIQTLPAIYREMLHQIACHRIPYRPDRNEPRAVKRYKRHYPSLKETRSQWRQKSA
jgi:hypothetical protein